MIVLSVCVSARVYAFVRACAYGSWTKHLSLSLSPSLSLSRFSSLSLKAELRRTHAPQIDTHTQTHTYILTSRWSRWCACWAEDYFARRRRRKEEEEVEGSSLFHSFQVIFFPANFCTVTHPHTRVALLPRKFSCGCPSGAAGVPEAEEARSTPMPGNDSGPSRTRAIEPRYRPPGQRGIHR